MRTFRLAAIAAALAIPIACVGAVPAALADPITEPDPAVTSPLAEMIGTAIEDDPSITTPAEIAAAASLPEEGGGSLQFDTGQRVSVLVFLDDGADREAIIAAAAAAGGALEPSDIDVGISRLRGWVEPQELDDLAAVPGVASVVPNLRPFTGADRAGTLAQLETALPGLRSSEAVRPAVDPSESERCGPIPIEADAPLRADDAREQFGVDGAGVRIGILSDSFATAIDAQTTWADDVRSGALPGQENPCGYTTDVVRIVDDEDGSDEGRAMAQLVHGIAPGATLKFANGGGDEGLDGMARNIDDLVDSGVDVIVDDLTWPTETYYQKNAISNAYDRARASGVAVFTSAGNATGVGFRGESEGRPISSWQTKSYRPMECPAWALMETEQDDSGPTVDCLDFDPSTEEQAYDALAMGISDSEEGGAATDLQLLGSTGQAMFGVNSVFEVRFFQEVAGDDPVFLDRIPMIGGPYPGISGKTSVDEGVTLRMVLVRTSVNGFSPTDPVNAAAATDRPAIYLGFIRGGDAIGERSFLGNVELGDAATDWVGGTVFGHAADGSALSTASLDWENPTEVRDYSSLGPVTLLFEPVDAAGAAQPSPRLPSPQLVTTPNIAAVDGTQTTFFGSNFGTPEDPEYRFNGTSAASPHAAAVAALGLSLNPLIRGTELEQAVVDTARGPDNLGPTNPYAAAGFTDSQVFGAGIVDAVRLLERVQPEPQPEEVAAPTGFGVDRAAVTQSSLRVVWDAPEIPVEGYDIAIVEGKFPAVAQQGASVRMSIPDTQTLPGTATSHEFTGLSADTAYSVRLTAVRGDARSDSVVLTDLRTLPAASDEGSGAGDVDAGTADTSRGGATSLPQTGGQDLTPWFVAGGALLIALAGGLITVGMVRRRSRAE